MSNLSCLSHHSSQGTTIGFILGRAAPVALTEVSLLCDTPELVGSREGNPQTHRGGGDCYTGAVVDGTWYLFCQPSWGSVSRKKLLPNCLLHLRL